MFSGLKNLKWAVATFSDCKQLTGDIDGMFDGCTNIESVARAF